MDIQVSNFGLTGFIKGFTLTSEGVIEFEDENIEHVIVPADKKKPLQIVVRLQSGKQVSLNAERRRWLSKLSLIPFGNEEARRANDYAEASYLEFLRRRGMPEPVFEGSLRVTLLWRLERDGVPVADTVVVGSSFDSLPKPFVERYSSGKLWTELEDDENLQSKLRPKPGTKAHPLGAHVAGDYRLGAESRSGYKVLFLGKFWGESTRFYARNWRRFRLRGKHSKLIRTPARPPEDHVLKFE